MAFSVPPTTPGKKKKEKDIRARFVRDDTFPDGSVIKPGDTFVKTWTIKNSGQDTWPEDTTLLHVGGDMELRASEPRINVGAVEKAQEKQVSVNLTAPTTAGRYWSYWRLVSGKDQRSRRCGLRVWADVSVKEASNDEDQVKDVETVKDEEVASKCDETVKEEEVASKCDEEVASKDDDESDGWEKLPVVPSEDVSPDPLHDTLQETLQEALSQDTTPVDGVEVPSDAPEPSQTLEQTLQQTVQEAVQQTLRQTLGREPMLGTSVFVTGVDDDGNTTPPADATAALTQGLSRLFIQYQNSMKNQTSTN